MKEQHSRIRQEGTVVTVSSDFDNPVQAKIDAFRKIVSEKQFAVIDGYMVDLFSASAVVAVYDALNEENKFLYAEQPVPIMVTWAFKLMSK